jgi:hypothetical protein
MQRENKEHAGYRSLSNLIAWLGLCLLSAGLGASMPCTLRSTWLYLGSSGLAAAVGLSSIEKLRRSNESHRDEPALQAQAAAM